ncbi:hypothetical protein [Arthrobacter sp. UYEF20]|uniref:hypothetical protein n=1 Tax=Arthrobacter sp. UYEF20 TaxID=1756363 RepID=UPI003391CDD5
MEDPYTVSLHLIFLGTLMLGFTMFLAGLVLCTALLALAVAARLLALTARGLFRRTVLRHRWRPRPLGQASGTGRSGSANERRAAPTAPQIPSLPGMPGGRTAGSDISGISGQLDAKSGVQDEDPVTATQGYDEHVLPGFPGGPSAR